MSTNVFSQTSLKSQEVTTNFFNDERFNDEQWVFNMINLLPVWQAGIFGSGIRVRINDNGVEADHFEFQGRFDWKASCDADVEPEDDKEHHGTAVASIVAAAGNNSDCAVGIAPLARLSACNALKSSEAFLSEKLDQVDVSQNSYERPACRSRRYLPSDDGLNTTATCPFLYSNSFPSFDPCQFCDFDADTKSEECEKKIVKYCRFNYENDVLACSDFLDIIIGGMCNYNVLSETARVGIATGIQEGREGKGIIYVFASGNAYKKGDVTTIKGYTNTRFTITVGAVGKDGLHASYSTSGASVFITAPSGDVDTRHNHYTALAGGTCGWASVGTSFACPVVSGVVALVLEANPDLTWRDVQGVLALTSQRVEDTRDTTAKVNGAGLWHSNLYGFGIVDAAAAVEAAQAWTLYDAEQMIVEESGRINLPIVDDPSKSVVSVITVDEEQDLIAESVIVFLDVRHFSRGDLTISLTSPHGTTSILHPGKLPENSQDREEETFKWKLQTVKHYGETAAGDWSLVVTDAKVGHAKDCVDVPFTIVYTGVTVTCSYLKKFEICLDQGLNDDFFNSGNYGPLLLEEDSGHTMEEACCSCGGGYSRENYEDTLEQWRLVVYGREAKLPPSQYPSMAPSEADWRKGGRSVSPSSHPTSTQGPTSAHQTGQTVSPTQAPVGSGTNWTEYTSDSPSFSPTYHISELPTPIMINASTPTDGPTSDTLSTFSSIPSDWPSEMPSDQPSARPSQTVSPTPTNTRATRFPTISPTTSKPTHSTDMPSTFPSDTPSGIPSYNPSLTPSEAMSSAPTMTPTGRFSTISPTINMPSGSPSGFPTALPTRQFSGSPSSNPTDGNIPIIPSTSPVVQPQPSRSPSSQGTPPPAPFSKPTIKPVPASPPGTSSTHESTFTPTGGLSDVGQQPAATLPANEDDRDGSGAYHFVAQLLWLHGALLLCCIFW